jgi:hypothetical protein
MKNNIDLLVENTNKGERTRKVASKIREIPLSESSVRQTKKTETPNTTSRARPLLARQVQYDLIYKAKGTKRAAGPHPQFQPKLLI